MTLDLPVHNQQTSLFGDHSEGHRVWQTARVMVKWGKKQEEDVAEVLLPLLGHILCDLQTSPIAANSTKLESKTITRSSAGAAPAVVVQLSSRGKGGLSPKSPLE